MKIDRTKLLLEIKKMERELYRTKSFMDYRIKLFSLLSLYEAYTKLTGDAFELDFPYIAVHVERYANIKGYLDEFLDEYFDNQREHNKLSGKILGTFHRSKFTTLYLENGTRKLDDKFKFELINEFLLDLNPKIAKLFNYMLMNGFIDTENRKTNNNVTYSDCFNLKSYIIVEQLDNIYDIDVLMHELGHVYSSRMNDNKSKIQSIKHTRHFYEMFSLYMELCFIDYLKKNHILERDTAIVENSFYTFMYTYFYQLKLFNSIEDDGYLHHEYTGDLFDAFIYGYGHYLSMLIHERQLSDKEGTIEMLDDYLSYQGLMTYDEQLEYFSLNRDKLKDMKVLKKRLEEHNKLLDKHIKL